MSGGREGRLKVGPLMTPTWVPAGAERDLMKGIFLREEHETPKRVAGITNPSNQKRGKG